LTRTLSGVVPERDHDGVGDGRRDPATGPRPAARRARTVRTYVPPTVGVATVSGRFPGFPVQPGGPFRRAARRVVPPFGGPSRVLPLGLWVGRGSATSPLMHVGPTLRGSARLAGGARSDRSRLPGGFPRLGAGPHLGEAVTAERVAAIYMCTAQTGAEPSGRSRGRDMPGNRRASPAPSGCRVIRRAAAPRNRQARPPAEGRVKRR
jgi:hypothetical protein